jgi:hypothetical protein
MYIFQEAMTPQGAAANVHRVQKIEITPAMINITVSSFVDDTSQLLVWQDAVEMPLIEFSTGSYPDNVYEWLVSPAGPFPAGAVVTEAPELETKKMTTKVSINILRAKEIAKGCTTLSGVVDTDEVSLRNIMATYQTAVLAMITEQPFSTDWRLKNDTLVTLNAMDMIAIGNAVLGRVKLCYENSWALKEQIDAATDISELEQVSITSGWPEV